MPVDVCPCFTCLLLVGVPLLFLRVGGRAAAIAAAISALLVAGFFLALYIPGWRLRSRAQTGDPVAEYQYAQWLDEVHPAYDPPQPVVPMHLAGEYDGFAWLQKAAAQNYPPAVWLVGVRLKYGIAVPEPADWHGPGGNVFAQPDVGQPLIDHAINDLDFHAPADEPQFYFEQRYLKGAPP